MKKLKWINIAATSVLIAGSAAAGMLPRNIAGEADASLLAVSPAALSIWGLIFGMLLIFLAYQAGWIDRENSDRVVEELGPWYAEACVFGTLHAVSRSAGQIWISLAMLPPLLAALTVAVNRLRDIPGSVFEKLCAKAGIQMYFGWTLILVLSEFGALITVPGQKLLFGTAELWTVLLLAAGTVLGIVIIAVFRRIPAGAAMAWGYLGILANLTAKEGWSAELSLARGTALTGLITLIAAIGVMINRRLKEGG